MKIAYYVDSNTVGGAEIVLRDLVAALEAEHDVTVIGVDPAVVASITADRPGTHQIVIAPIRGRFDVLGMRAHRHVFTQLAADVLHVNLSHFGACQWALCVAKTVPGLRVVAVEHSLVAPGSRSSRMLKHVTARLVDAEVAVGHRSARRIESMLRLRAGSVRTIHNGVHERAPVPHHGVDGALEIGWIGRMDPAKGLAVLFDALARVPGTRALLVGDGQERASLERRARELGLSSRVTFRPWSDDARAALDASDVFVLPSLVESFPLTVLEAMMVALPVVASDVGSIAEAVVDGETGILVPPGSVDALAAALQRLRDDATLRAAMGKAGHTVACERFDVATMRRAYVALYEDVMARSRSAAARAKRRPHCATPR